MDYREIILKQCPEIEYDRIDELVSIMNTVDATLPKGMPLKQIKEKALELIQKEFLKGGHRKLLGKKMRKKLDGYIGTFHSKIYKTYMIYKIGFVKDSIIFDFSVINYVNTDNGVIYIHRSCDVHPDITVFTAHFFDRLMERGYGKNARDRSDAIFTFLLDYLEVQKGFTFTVVASTNGDALNYMGHGIALGKAVMLPVNDRYEFTEVSKAHGACGHNVQVRFFLTYVSEDMLDEQQRKLIARGREMHQYSIENKVQTLEFNLEEE